MYKAIFLTLTFFFVFSSCTATPVTWTNLGGNFYPSSNPSVFQYLGVYYFFARDPSSLLMFGTCSSPCTTGPSNWVSIVNSNYVAIGGSPTATYVKTPTEFHAFAIDQTNPTGNTNMLRFVSKDLGITWTVDTLPQPTQNLGFLPGQSSTVASYYLGHVVHILLSANSTLYRYYYYSNTLPLTITKISTNALQPIPLLKAWYNTTDIDTNNHHFDVFAIGTDGKLYENMWDSQGPSWSSVMTATGLTGVNGSSFFATVDPPTVLTEATLRVFVVAPNGDVRQATRTWTNRKNYIKLTAEWQLLTGVSILSGPELCSRPVGYSDAGTVTLFSIGSTGNLYTTSFLAQ